MDLPFVGGVAQWYRTLVFDRRTFPVLRLTASWTDDHFVGQTSAVGQPTRPTQPFILTGSINERTSSAGDVTVHSIVVPPGELRVKAGVVLLAGKTV